MALIEATLEARKRVQQYFLITDKIIGNKTPEELARYVNRLCYQQARTSIQERQHMKKVNKIKIMVKKHENKFESS
jgi:hypothetical protein